MKKMYVTPEMEDFKFEIPQLFQGEIDPEGEEMGGSGEEGGEGE